MANITAAAVKSLRDKTQLPMMECKRALAETDGDEQAAIELLRKQGHTKMMGRADRSTDEGRIANYVSLEEGVGAMVELQCESASVAGHEDFVQLAKDLATQLAKGPGAETAEALLSQASKSQDGTLQQRWDGLTNTMREVFRLTRLVRCTQHWNSRYSLFQSYCNPRPMLPIRPATRCAKMSCHALA